MSMQVSGSKAVAKNPVTRNGLAFGSKSKSKQDFDEQKTSLCAQCGNIFKNKFGLSLHLKNKHSLGSNTLAKFVIKGLINDNSIWSTRLDQLYFLSLWIWCQEGSIFITSSWSKPVLYNEFSFLSQKCGYFKQSFTFYDFIIDVWGIQS